MSSSALQDLVRGLRAAPARLQQPSNEVLILTGTGFAGADRLLVRELADLCGLCYLGDLVRGRTTHLVALGEAGLHSDKVAKALDWGVPVLSLAWLLDSAAGGGWRPLAPYLLLARQLPLVRPPAPAHKRPSSIGSNEPTVLLLQESSNPDASIGVGQCQPAAPQTGAGGEAADDVATQLRSLSISPQPAPAPLAESPSLHHNLRQGSAAHELAAPLLSCASQGEPAAFSFQRSPAEEPPSPAMHQLRPGDAGVPATPTGAWESPRSPATLFGLPPSPGAGTPMSMQHGGPSSGRGSDSRSGGAPSSMAASEGVAAAGSGSQGSELGPAQAELPATAAMASVGLPAGSSNSTGCRTDSDGADQAPAAEQPPGWPAKCSLPGVGTSGARPWADAACTGGGAAASAQNQRSAGSPGARPAGAVGGEGRRWPRLQQEWRGGASPWAASRQWSDDDDDVISTGGLPLPAAAAPPHGAAAAEAAPRRIATGLTQHQGPLLVCRARAPGPAALERGDGSGITALKLLQRAPRGSVVKSSHGLAALRDVQFAEQVHLQSLGLALSTKDKKTALALPPPLGGGAHGSTSPTGSLPGGAALLVEPQAFYRLPGGEWRFEYCRFYGFEEAKALAAGAGRHLALPPGFDPLTELLRGSQRGHAPLSSVTGSLEVRRVRQGGAPLPLRGAARRSFFWRHAIDDATGQLVMDRPASDVVAAG